MKTICILLLLALSAFAYAGSEDQGGSTFQERWEAAKAARDRTMKRRGWEGSGEGLEGSGGGRFDAEGSGGSPDEEGSGASVSTSFLTTFLQKEMQKNNHDKQENEVIEEKKHKTFVKNII